MSATTHYTQITDPHLLDIVDEAWMRDKLPEDNIPLPQGVTAPSEETDEAQQDPQQQPQDKEKWLDLGLNTMH
eukprot:jgi/Chrzof1/1171/Cz01g43110.t1